MKTIVIHHSADFDGLFCREIARKFLPDAELIGWDFKDAHLSTDLLDADVIYVMDLPVDRVFGDDFTKNRVSGKGFLYNKVIWIDHHASSIQSHPTDFAGYRIDGVSACRLAWQWFNLPTQERDEVLPMPAKQDFIDRTVDEPLAVRLAGEYDIWDKRDPRAELFQHGLRSRDLNGWWEAMISDEATATIAEIENRLEQGSKFELLPNGNIKVPGLGDRVVASLLRSGEVIQYVRAQEYADVITQQGFDVEFEGVKFLACNSHELDIRSHLFEAGIKPHHEGLLGFTYNGKDWRVSLYRPPGKETDILSIAKKYGGGGHVGACGFRADKLPFIHGL